VWVELGKVGAPYGVNGWVRVESFTDPIESLLGYRVWQLSRSADERAAWKVLEGKTHGKGLIVRLEGVPDCDGAARLRGARIEVPRADLPPTRRREHYQIDLIGLKATNEEGIELGVVSEFVAAPEQTLMVVIGQREYWIPAVPEHLLKVSWDTGELRVRWPAEETAGGAVGPQRGD